MEQEVSMRTQLKREIHSLELQSSELAEKRIEALSNYALFMAVNNAYNLAIQRKILAERKLANIIKSRPINGIMESYEITVQLPRIR